MRYLLLLALVLISGDTSARSMGRWQRSSGSGMQSIYTTTNSDDSDTPQSVVDTGLCLNAWPHLEPFTVPATTTAATTATATGNSANGSATQSSLWTTAPLLYSTDTAGSSNSGNNDAQLWQVYEGDSAGGFGTCRYCYSY
jgi:hypothetical protein